MNKLTASVMPLIDEELKRANEKFPLFSSDHEAYGVIGEEIKEVQEDFNALYLHYLKFRNEVFCDSVDSEKRATIKSIERQAMYLACEAIQVAAMAKKWEMSKEPTEEITMKPIERAVEWATTIKLTDREKAIFEIESPSFLKGTKFRLEGSDE